MECSRPAAHGMRHAWRITQVVLCVLLLAAVLGFVKMAAGKSGLLHGRYC